MAEDRNMELLAKAADAFADGRDPFSTPWLSEHGVTLDECYALSQSIAELIRGYLAAPLSYRTGLLLFKAAEGTPLSQDHIMEALFHRHFQKRMAEV